MVRTEPMDGLADIWRRIISDELKTDEEINPRNGPEVHGISSLGAWGSPGVPTAHH